MTTNGYIRSQQQCLSIISSNLFSLPPMTSISSHLSLLLIFPILSLILSPFIFLSPSCSHFFCLLTFLSLIPLLLLHSFISPADLYFCFVPVPQVCASSPPLMSPHSAFLFTYLHSVCFIYPFISPTSTLPPCQQERIRFIYIQPVTPAIEIY